MPLKIKFIKGNTAQNPPDGFVRCCLNTLADMEGVSSAVLVSYNGDYMG